MRVGKEAIPKRHFIPIVVVLLALTFLAGCGIFGGSDDSAKNMEGKKSAEQPVSRYTGEKSKAISFVYTTKRTLALTFNGMGDAKTMNQLLDELDLYHIKATFFLPGMRVAEEPDIAQDILARGHEIENNTLNQLDMSKLRYDQVYKEIQLSDQIITKETGVTPKYVRTKSGEFTDDVRLAAAHNGQDAVISYSLFLHNWQNETEQQKKNYLRKYINRGGIITLDIEENTHILKTIPLIAEAAADVGYEFVTLNKLVEQGGERKPLEAIEGYDTVQINPNNKAKYDLIYRKETSKKKVVLTFDDWGTDYTITKILDILDKYHIKASFFLRADGVEKNPNLARAIAEAGHDVGNHTYSHPVLSTITPTQLQEEVVKAYQVITEAIQEKPAMLFRPPTGNINDTEAGIIAATGYETIANYDVDPNDWNKNKSADDIVKGILGQTRSGSVILLHMLDDIQTIEALPIAIESLERKGFTFVTMTDMISQK
ncbi:polysaccharide deacetylase family protein [Paenibacillus sp. IHBB 10380]|uniref:polysaccharide deacetylase family protein n=1 Tax=Paenibacillus sp. IHBB 10380 TaxID=1566358 RepID=UPI0005CFB742|nr:polysaccharide deacetylase family protein [Paenibacillus sp. IHBB 10380]AJS59554.1 chitin deacetylase [Paenibacillus sp. IHBB 10380]